MVHMESFDIKISIFLFDKSWTCYMFFISQNWKHILYTVETALSWFYALVSCTSDISRFFNECFKLHVIIAILTKKITVHYSKYTFYFTIHVTNRKYNDQRRSFPIDYVQISAYVFLLKYGKHFVVVRRVFRKQSLSSLLSLLEKTLFQGRDFV